MREIKLVLLEPEHLVIGEEVFCINNGKGVITGTESIDSVYTIKVVFSTNAGYEEDYTPEGKMYSTDILPSLYKRITTTFPPFLIALAL